MSTEAGKDRDEHPLGKADLQRWAEEAGGRLEFHPLEAETPTVAAAAVALGVKPEQVIKSLVFWVDEGPGGGPVLVIGSGLDRVNLGKLAQVLGTAKQAIRFAPPGLALELTGYATGTMPPFGHRQKLPTLIDRRVARQPFIYGGCGDHRDMLSCATVELLRLTRGRVVDVMGE